MKQLRTLMLVSLAALAAACSSTPPAPPVPKEPDLSGQWVLTIQSRMGTQDSQMTLQQSGRQIAGTITGEAGDVPYSGTVDGTAVNFSFILRVQGMDLRIEQIGTLQGETAMAGRSVFGTFGEGTFTARKQ